jgi:hypothetical protein
VALAQAAQFVGAVFRQQREQRCGGFRIDLSRAMPGQEVTLESEQQIARAPIERAAGLVDIAVRSQRLLHE